MLAQPFVVGEQLVQDDIEHEGRIELHQLGAAPGTRHHPVGKGQWQLVGAEEKVTPDEKVQLASAHAPRFDVDVGHRRRHAKVIVEQIQRRALPGRQGRVHGDLMEPQQARYLAQIPLAVFTQVDPREVLIGGDDLGKLGQLHPGRRLPGAEEPGRGHRPTYPGHRLFSGRPLHLQHILGRSGNVILAADQRTPLAVARDGCSRAGYLARPGGVQ